MIPQPREQARNFIKDEVKRLRKTADELEVILDEIIPYLSPDQDAAIWYVLSKMTR